jgi:hypothetical protein
LFPVPRARLTSRLSTAGFSRIFVVPPSRGLSLSSRSSTIKDPSSSPALVFLFQVPLHIPSVDRYIFANLHQRRPVRALSPHSSRSSTIKSQYFARSCLQFFVSICLLHVSPFNFRICANLHPSRPCAGSLRVSSRSSAIKILDLRPLLFCCFRFSTSRLVFRILDLRGSSSELSRARSRFSPLVLPQQQLLVVCLRRSFCFSPLVLSQQQLLVVCLRRSFCFASIHLVFRSQSMRGRGGVCLSLTRSRQSRVYVFIGDHCCWCTLHYSRRVHLQTLPDLIWHYAV